MTLSRLGVPTVGNGFGNRYAKVHQRLSYVTPERQRLASLGVDLSDIAAFLVGGPGSERERCNKTIHDNLKKRMEFLPAVLDPNGDKEARALYQFLFGEL